jgi:hypothetical protein
MNTTHKIIVDGGSYNFEVVSEDFGDEADFYIRAISKTTRRTSCINNLNAVLSELLSEHESENYDFYPEYYDSTWVVSKSKAKRFIRKAKKFLSDSKFVAYLENKLDEDREESEWENIITENGEIKEYEEKE